MIIKKWKKRLSKKYNRKHLKWNILLITNRDSDNVGDQVIEISDIGLIHTIMKNSGFTEEEYSITSRAAGFVTKKYLETKDVSLLKDAECAIKDADLIIFGGAPLFNYKYQVFYERTAITLEIAQKYNKPVLFSGIGIESYDSDNIKCQRLKKTLNFECVKQITTRDGIDYLNQYIDNKNIVINKVSDPAVFSSNVFKNYSMAKNNERKKVGIFVLRANGFLDNGVNINRNDAAELWISLVHELEKKDMDYEFLTSGHFGDEAFLDRLIRMYNINPDKCVFNINDPETLLQKMSEYDGIVSCRLHPSIISYSLGIPSIGIVWNSKVSAFYENIGYAERTIDIREFKAEVVADKIEKSMKQGVEQNRDFMMSVYNTLFCGIHNVLCADDYKNIPYSYDELIKNMWRYRGTSGGEKKQKLKRKFRRTYDKYNKVSDKYNKVSDLLKEKTEILRELTFHIIYHSGTNDDGLKIKDETVKTWRTKSGAYEYEYDKRYCNSGDSIIEKVAFEYPENSFVGWRMRIKDEIGNWYWYTNKQELMPLEQYDSTKKKMLYRLQDEGMIPYLKNIKIDVIVLEAEWES